MLIKKHKLLMSNLSYFNIMRVVISLYLAPFILGIIKKNLRVNDMEPKIISN